MRAPKDGATGPHAFTLLVHLLTRHFDRVGTGAGYTRLHTFGVSSGTPFCEYNYSMFSKEAENLDPPRIIDARASHNAGVGLDTKMKPTLLKKTYPISAMTQQVIVPFCAV